MRVAAAQKLPMPTAMRPYKNRKKRGSVRNEKTKETTGVRKKFRMSKSKVICRPKPLYGMVRAAVVDCHNQDSPAVGERSSVEGDVAVAPEAARSNHPANTTVARTTNDRTNLIAVGYGPGWRTITVGMISLT